MTPFRRRCQLLPSRIFNNKARSHALAATRTHFRNRFPAGGIFPMPSGRIAICFSFCDCPKWPPSKGCLLLWLLPSLGDDSGRDLEPSSSSCCSESSKQKQTRRNLAALLPFKHKRGFQALRNPPGIDCGGGGDDYGGTLSKRRRN